MSRTSSDTLLIQALEANGPCLSSELARRLVAAGVRSDAARQRIARAGGPVQRLPLRLAHNQRFLYLNRQYQQPDYWDALWRALEETGSAYGHACAALEARGGIVAHSDWAAASGSPRDLRSRLSAERVLHALVTDVRILERVDLPDLGSCIRFATSVPIRVDDARVFRARRLAEAVLLDLLRGWLRRNSLVSFDAARIRGETPRPDFTHFDWDLTGPSYVAPMVTRGGGAPPLPGFVVADVVLGREVSRRAVMAFAAKCATVRGQNGARPFLSLFVTDRLAHDALRAGRDAGVVCTTVSELFGHDVGEALRRLVATLSDAARAAAGDPDELARLLDALSRVEGAVNNVRGAFLELIVAHCIVRHEGLDVTLGERASDGHRQADIDVLGRRDGQRALAIECKAHGADAEIEAEVVERWLSEKVPVIRRWLTQTARHQYQNVEFSFWTTARFSAEALELLERARARTRAYTVSWRDGAGLLTYAGELHGEAITRMLREHIFEHPVVGRHRGKRRASPQVPQGGAAASGGLRSERPPRSDGPGGGEEFEHPV